MASQLTGFGMRCVRRFLSEMTNVIKNGKPPLIEAIHIPLPELLHALIIRIPSVKQPARASWWLNRRLYDGYC
jgi:hypothetical protein